MLFDVFLSGLIAGYGIAIPVGPIAILILELGLRRGFWTALSAGAGAASADLIYATIAALAGTFLVSILAPYASILRIVSALTLVAIGVWLLSRGRNPSSRGDKPKVSALSCSRTYTMFLGLTILNPLTVTYFTTLILGMGANSPPSWGSAVLFVSGAFLASLSWQSLLATISGLAHTRLSARIQAFTFTVGNCVIITLGIVILLGLRI